MKAASAHDLHSSLHIKGWRNSKLYFQLCDSNYKSLPLLLRVHSDESSWETELTKHTLKETTELGMLRHCANFLQHRLVLLWKEHLSLGTTKTLFHLNHQCWQGCLSKSSTWYSFSKPVGLNVTLDTVTFHSCEPWQKCRFLDPSRSVSEKLLPLFSHFPLY